MPLAYKYLSLYLGFNLIIEIGAHLMSHSGNNLPLLHVYTLGEFWLWSLFFRELLGNDSWLRRYFVPITTIVSVLVVSNTLWLQPIWGFNSHAKTLVQVIIIAYSLSFAFHFSQDTTTISPQLTQLLRFINAIVLVYYCATLFVFMSSGFWLKYESVMKVLVSFNKGINRLFHCLILYALWKVTRFLRNSSSSRVSVS